MRRRKIVGIGFMLCIMLAGCSFTIPEMTQEQEDLIVRYAANVALKYDVSYESRLVDLSQIPETTYGSVPEEKEPTKMDPVVDTETNDISQEAVPEYTIHSFYNLQGIEINYSSFEICPSYSSDQSEDYNMPLDAEAGKNLLVMFFEVKNVTSEAIELDFLSCAPRFRTSINKGNSTNVLLTMLSNDMGVYIGQIQAEDVVELVLISEIKEDITEIETIELIMQNQTDSAKILLQ